MRHDKGEGVLGEFQIGVENFIEGISRQFKPDTWYGVVDMPQYVHVPETRVYGYAKHDLIIKKSRMIFKGVRFNVACTAANMLQ